MANEIYHNFDEGSTLYAIIHRKTDDKVFDNVDGGDTWEVWNDSNVDNYDVPMTDHDGNYYSVDFPAAITTAGIYRVTIFKQAGGSPHADNDTCIAHGELRWDGSTEVSIAATVDEMWAEPMSDLAAGDMGKDCSVLKAINYLYEALRNKTVTDKTNSELIIYRDDGSEKLCEADISDDGNLFTKGKFGAAD